MTPEEELVRANRAREVLENPIFVEAVEKVDAEIERAWRCSPATDTTGREQLWLMQRLLEKVVGHLNQTMKTGQMAQEQLRWKETNEKRAREFRA